MFSYEPEYVLLDIQHPFEPSEEVSNVKSTVNHLVKLSKEIGIIAGGEVIRMLRTDAFDSYVVLNQKNYWVKLMSFVELTGDHSLIDG